MVRTWVRVGTSKKGLFWRLDVDESASEVFDGVTAAKASEAVRKPVKTELNIVLSEVGSKRGVVGRELLKNQSEIRW